MKTKLIIAIASVILILLGIISVLTSSLKAKDNELKVAMANIKNYNKELVQEKNKSTAYQLTVDQLYYFQDSVLRELDNTRKELRIKDKNLKALQAVQSSFKKTDTIRITQVDTLFREPDLNIDTLLGDTWYSVQIGLKYPNTISVSPEFKSEKHIVVSSKKETVEPPKKFFIARWLQKKHIVLKVDVIEKNPYVEDETSKYIEIVK